MIQKVSNTKNKAIKPPQGYAPTHPKASASGCISESILVAEAAFKCFLPNGAQVHHIDRNPLNNKSNNLVVCQDNKYHHILHVRDRAYRATGNPLHRKCVVCKKWDDQKNLSQSKSQFYHRECKAKKEAIRRVNRLNLISKYIKPGVVLHHINHINNDYRNTNLVICENDEYRQILHRREKAFKSCGKAHYFRCFICKKYDDPENLYINLPTHVNHRNCANEYDKRWKEGKK